VTTMSRRDFVRVVGMAGLGLVTGCGRLPGQSSPQRVLRVGFLSSLSASDTTLLEPFRQGLHERGLVEGQNLTIEYRYADNIAERLPGLVSELVNAQPDVIVTSGTQAVSVVKNTTNTIPIVMLAAPDPVGTGLVASLAHPGGNLTGMTQTAPGLPGKVLELLAAVTPGVSRVAVLWNPGDVDAQPVFDDTQVAAQVLGLALHSMPVGGPRDFDAAFAAIIHERAEALNILGSTLLTGSRAQVADFALQHGLPSVYVRREYAVAGGLMTYGVSFPEMARRAAGHVAKILEGTHPAGLPVEQPMRFDFVINLKTERALGLTIPPHVLLQATEVIQ
jgi:putative ABC transport system substrate-binding protein